MVYFNKTYPEPTSLSVENKKGLRGDYKKADVTDQLKKDFHDKCYICESKHITAINVEHFEPHEKKDMIKRFNWSNLFWSCSHCNGIKSNIYKNLLNCTVKEDKVDERIKYDTNFKASSPKDKVVIEAISNDTQTLITVELLQLVYKGDSTVGTPKNVTDLREHQAGALRQKLFDELLKFKNHIDAYYVTDDEDTKQDRLSAIIRDLSNHSKFTAFKRYIVRNDPDYLSEFGKYIID